MQSYTSRQRLFVSIAILFIGAGWTWGSRDTTGTSTGGEIPAPQVGFLAPDFTLQNEAGEFVSLSDFRGKVVLVNLWASWCGPCLREMPAMQSVYDQYKEQGFIVLAVNITSQDSRANAIAFAESLNLTFPILFDVNGVVALAYQMRAFPSSYFIGSDGIIHEVIIGGPMAEALLQVRVEQLLKDVE
ncbi:MAG: TlpA family protein disulfide reductase [Chloroflexi bacterium]|nr:TlpA family protein disulfide reductase [Chloroflexota bacterium]